MPPEPCETRHCVRRRSWWQKPRAHLSRHTFAPKSSVRPPPRADMSSHGVKSRGSERSCLMRRVGVVHRNVGQPGRRSCLRRMRFRRHVQRQSGVIRNERCKHVGGGGRFGLAPRLHRRLDAPCAPRRARCSQPLRSAPLQVSPRIAASLQRKQRCAAPRWQRQGGARSRREPASRLGRAAEAPRL